MNGMNESNQEYIVISGARENNLKNVSLRIPKRKITIFTRYPDLANPRSSLIRLLRNPHVC